MKLFKTVVLAGLFIAAAPLAAAAQTLLPFTVEVRGGVGIPVGDFKSESDFGATPGLALGGTVGFRVVPMLDIYGGYSRDSFGCSDNGEFEGQDCDMHSKGFEVGARMGLPGMIPLAPWVRAGALFHKLEISGSEGGFSASINSDRAFGYEIGAGISMPVVPTLTLTPGVRYRGYTAKFGDFGEGNVSYLVLDVGARVGL